MLFRSGSRGAATPLIAQVSGGTLRDATLPFEIRISTDEAARTITFEDTGVGMSRDELVENLGTIARSGSRTFLKKLQDAVRAPPRGDLM